MFNLKHGIIKELLSTLTILSLLINHAVFANSVAQSQRMLNQLGYNAGPVDGAYGGKTKRAHHKTKHINCLNFHAYVYIKLNCIQFVVIFRPTLSTNAFIKSAGELLIYSASCISNCNMLVNSKPTFIDVVLAFMVTDAGSV